MSIRCFKSYQSVTTQKGAFCINFIHKFAKMKSQNKQTAVEWLVEKLMKAEFINNADELIEQAKQMEKQQIIDAWNDGNCNTDLKGNPSANYALSAEYYYNQKYAGKQ